MDDSLKSKLAADIDKSGFGSEMRAIRVFLAKEWGCKACEDYVSQDFFSGDYLKMFFKDVSYLTICNPVIILDGLLVSARLTDKGKTRLDEIEYAPFEFDFRSAKYERGGYRVDLVTLKYLDSYLDLCASRANRLAEKIQEFQADEFLEQE